MTDKVELLQKLTAFDGYFKIVRYHLRHRLFAGGWSGEVVREVFERGHAAAVLPYDPVRDEVVLIEQFRAGAYAAHSENPWLLEVVAGIMEVGETPEQVAIREAQEEAGCVISDLIPMYQFLVSPGGTSETTAIFCGRVSTQGVGGIHGLVEENEDIQVHVVKFSEALKMLAEGKIRSAPPIIALQWLALHREDVRKQWGISA
ncbi:MAG: ADP-ribose pyrophosphatase [Pseudomonadota bacterium]